jgi:putative phosphoribosyl transferase
MKNSLETTAVQIPMAEVRLEGDLNVPVDAEGVVVFAHGSGSSRHSPRNQFVADVLQRHHMATLLMDLLTLEEERIDDQTGELRFDVKFLAKRLIGATDWLGQHPSLAPLPIGYFGASIGAAAALLAAPERPKIVRAVVSRGGRVDMATEALPLVRAATLFIVGELDDQVVQWNQEAFPRIGSRHKKLEIVPGATHLFEEPGALEKVADLAAAWFGHYSYSFSAGLLMLRRPRNNPVTIPAAPTAATPVRMALAGWS